MLSGKCWSFLSFSDVLGCVLCRERLGSATLQALNILSLSSTVVWTK